MKESFLQSREWLNFQKSYGKTTLDLSKNKSFSAKIIKEPLPLVGNYFYLPRGPEIKNKNDIKNVLELIIKKATDFGVNWVRIEPPSKEIIRLIQSSIVNLSLKKAPIDIQPVQNLWININLEPKEILSLMKPKTRYNIRLAQRKKVSVIKLSDFHFNQRQKLLHQFWQLIKKTSQRQRIKPYPLDYYQKMLQSLPTYMIDLYLAQYQDKIIAGAIVIFYRQQAIYLHGAFDDNFRQLMGPFALHWKIIQDAHKKNKKWYDLGGVKIKKDNNNLVAIESNWKGITRFKLGFSKIPKLVEYPGTYDIVLKKYPYFLYRFLRKIKQSI